MNCYKTGTAPCKTACPAHIAVQGYLKLAAQGKYKEALQLIKRDNPFPAVCGRICNRRCEDACTRGTIDQAVAIDEVKRFIAQQDLNAETRFVPEKVIPKVDGEFEEKIAIIGGGPAGLSCAYYLAEKGSRPTVFEKEKQPGGMLMHGIPEFRQEKDVIEPDIDVLRALGEEYALPDDLTLSTICRLPDIFTLCRGEEDEEELAADVLSVLQKALEQFVAMRETEGERLKADVLSRLLTMEEHLSFV